MITDKYLLKEREHPSGGVQRLYRFATGYGLSAVNSENLNAFPFAWEITVLENMTEDGEEYNLTYNTLLADEVKIFETDEETNEFILCAAKILSIRF